MRIGRLPAISRSAVFGLVAALAAVAACRGFIVEPRQVEPVSVTLQCKEIVAQPIRVLLFSDVDFRSEGPRERAVRAAAERFRPDIVLVAGDLLDLDDAITDPDIVEAARRFLASLPAPAGRFLVPGEEESRNLDPLVESWSDGTIEVLSNEARRIDVHGQCVDLFGFREGLDPQPWPVAGDADHRFVFTRWMPGKRGHRLVYRGPGPEVWRDVEATFAFQAVTDSARLDIRVGWEEGPGTDGGTGWRLVRSEGRDSFKAYGIRGPQTSLSGRTESGFAPPTGVWCRGRVRLTASAPTPRLQARFWIESEREPDGWLIDASDPTCPAGRAGSIALGGRWGERRYADLLLEDFDGHELLREDFSDLSRRRALWHSGSVLEAWQGRPTEPGCVRLVLTHNPDVVRAFADLGEPHPCVVLAGHTHGGQVRVPGFGPLFTGTRIGRRYDRGLFDYGGVPLYITPGVGTSIVPIRLFDKPEVTLLTISR